MHRRARRAGWDVPCPEASALQECCGRTGGGDGDFGDTFVCMAGLKSVRLCWRRVDLKGLLVTWRPLNWFWRLPGCFLGKKKTFWLINGVGRHLTIFTLWCKESLCTFYRLIKTVLCMRQISKANLVLLVYQGTGLWIGSIFKVVCLFCPIGWRSLGPGLVSVPPSWVLRIHSCPPRSDSLQTPPVRVNQHSGLANKKKCESAC